VGQVVEHLFSMLNALSSNPSTDKKRKSIGGRRKKKWMFRVFKKIEKKNKKRQNIS
jgi:hypothetical protein